MPSYLRQQKFPFGSLRKDPHWSTKGLVGLWQFKPAGKLIDETANKNHGTITGATWAGQGLLFDNASNFVRVEAIPLTKATFIVRAKPTANDSMALAMFQAAVVEDVQFYWSNTPQWEIGKVPRVPMGGSPDVFAHLVVTYDGTSQRVYIDGVRKNTQGGTIDTSGEPIIIGADPDATNGGSLGNWFGGIIEYVSVYNRALSATEIAELYKNPDLPMQQYHVLGKAPAVVGTTPKGPLTHPLYGPFAGPIAC